MTKVAQMNKIHAEGAAFLEAGRIANNKLTKLAKSKVPLMARGYVDTPVGKVILANAMAVAVDHFKGDNKVLNQLAQAMLVSAYQEAIASFDIEGLIDEFVSSSDITRSLRKLSDSSDE